MLAVVRNLTLSVDGGAVALTGIDANAALVEPIVDFGAVALSGFSANAALGVPLASGVFALSGFPANAALVEPIVDFGPFALAGQAATLRRGRVFSPSYGAIALIGRPATLSFGRTLALAEGVFALSGEPAHGSVVHKLPVGLGAFTLSGGEATAALVEPIVGFGAVLLTGEAATLTYNLRLTAAAGAVEVVGEPVSFSIGIAPPKSLELGFGGFWLTGGLSDWSVTLEEVGTAKFSWHNQALVGIVAKPALAAFHWKV